MTARNIFPGHETDPRWTAVDEYAFSKVHPETPSTTPSPATLDQALTHSAKNGLDDIGVAPLQGKFLKLQAQLVKARSVLEVGTLGGYSTIWLADASPDIRVVSIELFPHHAEVARANIERAGLMERAEVKVGAGLDVLPLIAEEVRSGKREKFQLVFIDADKTNNWNYVDLAIPLCTPGAVIIVDNVVRRGDLAHDVDDPAVQGARTVVENVGKDPRLDATVLQTVGEKNYDGFLFAIVK